MLILAIITAVLTGPGQTIGVAVFIDHFVNDLDLTRSEVSGAYLVGTLMGATLLPTVGRSIDHFGVRSVQLVVAMAFGAALVNMSQVNSLAWLAIGFVGIRFLGQGSLSLVSAVTVSVRFVRKRGTAIGIFATASSALMALVPVSLAFAIGRLGWRTTWVVAAAVVVGVAVPIAWFGLRHVGTATAGHGEQNRADQSEAGGSETPLPSGSAVEATYNRADAMRTPQFWLLAAVSGAAAMLGTGLTFHQIDLLGNAGIPATAAAALFIPQVAGSATAGLVAGYVGDRIGTRYFPAIGMVLLIVAHWLAAIVSPGFIAVVYSLALGAMGGSIRTTVATLLPNWFGTAHIGSIQGLLTLFTVGASALGPVALALVESGFGSYPPAVLALSALPTVALLFALNPKATFHPPRSPVIRR